MFAVVIWLMVRRGARPTPSSAERTSCFRIGAKGQAHVSICRSLRVLVAAGFAALIIGAAVASERTATSMANAASQFLTSLTPEQRQRAAFPFDSASG